MIVRTKEELEQARRSGEPEIVIEGELASRVRNGAKIVSVGRVTLAVLVAAIAAVPLTGGMSALAFASIGGLTGLEIALIAAVAFVGVGLLMAIWKEYEEVEFSHNPLKLRLRKRR